MDQLALHSGKQPPVSAGVCPESVSAIRRRGKSPDHARNPTTIPQLPIPYPKTLCTRTERSVNLTSCLPHFLVPSLVIPVLRPFNCLFLLSVFISYFAPTLSCFLRSYRTELTHFASSGSFLSPPLPHPSLFHSSA